MPLFTLLDSLGDVGGENLGPLIAYLSDRATYRVTTASPQPDVTEDHRIATSEWSVVSARVSSETES